MRMNGVGGSRAKLVFSALLSLVAVFLIAAPAVSQASPLREARVGTIDIAGLVPLQVSFEFRNTGQIDLKNVQGTATLNDRFGNTVEVIAIAPFSVAAGQITQVDASSRWEFQKPGIYLLEVALDIGLDTLVSKSLAFRITPILLPLAPPPSLDGEGLYTVSQQPVNWGISRINAPQAWHITHGSKDIIIAWIDSGVDFSIPQLAVSMWVNEDEIPENGIDDDRNGYVDDIHGWDFRDNDNSSLLGTKLHWHGTFTASIIAAWPGDNAIVGIAPGVKIMDLRFLDSKNLFYGSDWKKFAQAINYAVDNGARIINLSVYANAKPPSVLEQAFRRAAQRGVIIVGIAGNDGTAQVSYPGKYDSVIAVSATDRNDQLARFSNYGSEVTVTAPGEKITSLFPGGIAGTSSGTSFAAPHVTGALALILSVNPSMAADQALAILEGSAMDLGSQGRDRQFGYGLINVYNAVIRAGQ